MPEPFSEWNPSATNCTRRCEFSRTCRTTPGNFLFGGCGLGAALVALEARVRTSDGVGHRSVSLVCPDPFGR